MGTLNSGLCVTLLHQVFLLNEPGSASLPQPPHAKSWGPAQELTHMGELLAGGTAACQSVLLHILSLQLMK